MTALVALMFSTSVLEAAGASAYPLKLSENRWYLVDQKDAPFLDDTARRLPLPGEAR